MPQLRLSLSRSLSPRYSRHEELSSLSGWIRDMFLSQQGRNSRDSDALKTQDMAQVAAVSCPIRCVVQEIVHVNVSSEPSSTEAEEMVHPPAKTTRSERMHHEDIAARRMSTRGRASDSVHGCVVRGSRSSFLAARRRRPTHRIRGSTLLNRKTTRFPKPGQAGGQPRGKGGSGGASGVLSSLTAEQRSIVLTDLKPGQILTVLAFAGTGKTTCLRAYAQARPHLRILYLTFNVSVRDEAKKTFPPHVDCKGVHQVAYRHAGQRYRSKLKPELKEAEVQSFLKRRERTREVSLSAAALVLSTLGAFFSSDAPTLCEAHARRPEETSSSPAASPGHDDVEELSPSWSPARPTLRHGRDQPSVADPALVLSWAKMCWESMRETGSRGGGDQGRGGSSAGPAGEEGLCMTHAGYLKLFQLGRPCLGRSYDMIMLDEAQDCNPCIASIVLRETSCARVLVGDSHQAIYGFIGAEDHLKRVADARIRHLTQVFRFDHSIAHVANALVGTLFGETRPLLGSPAKRGQVVLAERTGVAVWSDTGYRVKRPIAFLGRTVASLVQAAILARRRGERIAWVGGADAYSLEAIEDMCLMAMGHHDKIRHALLRKLRTPAALQKFIRESGDRQWASRLRMLDGRDPSELLEELKGFRSQQVHPRNADTILSTVHKAKGLEFDTVVLADDFVEVTDIPWSIRGGKAQPVWSSRTDIEEVNILYVAVTRAKRVLVLNASLKVFLSNTTAWNSVSLRGVVGASNGDKMQGSTSNVKTSIRCSICGRADSLGGGSGTHGTLARRESSVVEATSRSVGALQLAGNRNAGGALRHDDQVVGGSPGIRFLYAASATQEPLCHGCVEGCPSPTQNVRRWYEEDSGTPSFPYARTLMRGLTTAVNSSTLAS